MAGAPEPGVAIRADTLHKAFRIPNEAVHTLKERALHPLRRRGFEELRALDGVHVVRHKDDACARLLCCQ